MTFFDEAYKRAIADGANPTAAVAVAISETDKRVTELREELVEAQMLIAGMAALIHDMVHAEKRNNEWVERGQYLLDKVAK